MVTRWRWKQIYEFRSRIVYRNSEERVLRLGLGLFYSEIGRTRKVETRTHVLILGVNCNFVLTSESV